jgi:hypothetical protein
MPMKTQRKTRPTESETIRELRALLAHAETLRRQNEEATSMAYQGYLDRRNEVLKTDR